VIPEEDPIAEAVTVLTSRGRTVEPDDDYERWRVDGGDSLTAGDVRGLGHRARPERRRWEAAAAARIERSSARPRKDTRARILAVLVPEPTTDSQIAERAGIPGQERSRQAAPVLARLDADGLAIGEEGGGGFRGGGHFRPLSPRYDPSAIPKRDLVLGPQLAGRLERDPRQGDGIDHRELRLDAAAPLLPDLDRERYARWNRCRRPDRRRQRDRSQAQVLVFPSQRRARRALVAARGRQSAQDIERRHVRPEPFSEAGD
jgi:hypothetical protein